MLFMCFFAGLGKMWCPPILLVNETGLAVSIETFNILWFLNSTAIFLSQMANISHCIWQQKDYSGIFVGKFFRILNLTSAYMKFYCEWLCSADSEILMKCVWCYISYMYLDSSYYSQMYLYLGYSDKQDVSLNSSLYGNHGIFLRNIKWLLQKATMPQYK